MESDKDGIDKLIYHVGVADAEGSASSVDLISVDKVSAGRKAPIYSVTGKVSQARLSGGDKLRLIEPMK